MSGGGDGDEGEWRGVMVMSEVVREVIVTRGEVREV